MEAKELMVGDLVLDIDNCPVKIRQILKYRVLVGNSRRQYENPIPLAVNFVNIKPIPLAEEILEKNGFVRQEEERGFSEPYILYINDDYGYPIKIYPKFYMDKAHHLYIGYDDEGTYLSLYINYFHELQHALRLVGLNEVADNLKV